MQVFLEWDEERGQWQGDADWSDDLVVELIAEADRDDKSAAIARAQSFLARIRLSDADIREAINKALLDVYNRYWSGPEEELTAEEFHGRWEVDLVAFRQDGAIDVYYQELNEHDELFGGHGILVSLRPDGTIAEAGLA